MKNGRHRQSSFFVYSNLILCVMHRIVINLRPVGCFVKLFFRIILLRFVPSFRIDTSVPRNEHFLPRNYENRSEFRGIFSERNSVPNPTNWSPILWLWLSKGTAFYSMLLDRYLKTTCMGFLLSRIFCFMLAAFFLGGGGKLIASYYYVRKTCEGKKNFNVL
jgi:hypothetical protein